MARLPRQTAYPGPYLLYMLFKNNNVPSKFGEPDAVPIDAGFSSKGKDPFVMFDKETGLNALNSVTPPAFILWLACLDTFRMRKERPFRFSKKLRRHWRIADRRLASHLKQLKDADLIKYRSEKNKAPLIQKVTMKR